MAERSTWRQELHEIIFETRTSRGRQFDNVILVMILISVFIVMLDSVPAIHKEYRIQLYTAEWIITILFTIEYILRVVAVHRRRKFVFSVLGIIDLLATLPTYLTLLMGAGEAILMVRTLRLLRVFRVFRIRNYMAEGRFMTLVLINSFKKISVFLIFALILLVILGSLMYMIESPREGFNSIPEGVYWAIVTMTTTGYGDVLPATVTGKFVASFMMLLGYAIIAVPIGIITTEMTLAIKNRMMGHEVCKNCHKYGHDLDADFCKFCGEKL
jgi:voltage-gated potassium channel